MVGDLALELAICKLDLQWRIERHLWIRDADGVERPIGKLKRGQLKLLKLIEYMRAHGYRQAIVCKDRKVGVSTLIQAYIFCQVIDHGYQALTVAHLKDSAAYLVDMFEVFHKHYDLPHSAMTACNSRGVKLANGGGNEIHTANKAESTRSRTPQIIHGSETSRWVYGNKAIIAINNAVAMTRSALLFDESTANSYDPFFQPRWENAAEHCRLAFDEECNPHVEVLNAEKWNGLIPVFLSVIENEDKRISFTTEAEREAFVGTLDDVERKMLAEQAVPLEYLKYKRWAIPNLCSGDIDMFNQEHPETSDIAFIRSGNPRFDVYSLAAMQPEDGEDGALARDDKHWAKQVRFTADKFGVLKIFRQPRANHRYVLGIDMSTGKESDKGDPDESVADLYDLDAGPWCEQVAIIGGRLSSEEIADPVLWLAEYFGWPLINTERSFADHLIVRLEREYPSRLLFRGPDHRTGYHTHAGTRNRIIDTLALAISKRGIMFHDRRTIAQCRSFVKAASGRFEAGSGAHDDYVIAPGLAMIAAEVYPAIRPLGVGATAMHQELAVRQVEWGAPAAMAKVTWDGYGEPGD